MKVNHEFGPFYNKDSEILILGSIPSPKSREEGFYYAHPQNRFWKVLAAIYQEQIPGTIKEKKQFLIKHKIALWDVLASCDIEGASDSTIKNPAINDLNLIIKSSNIKRIFTTGKTSYNLYNKYFKNSKIIKATYLPSTSPANCAISLEELVSKYNVLKENNS